jgi:hypothetical protein
LGTWGERVNRTSAFTATAGEDRRQAQGGERSTPSGNPIAKIGEVVAGPGL